MYQKKYAKYEEHYEVARKNGLKVGAEKPSDLNPETREVYQALSVFSSRNYQMSERAPISEIESYFRTFSTFEGTSVEFIRLYLLAEDLLTRKEND